MNVSLLKTMLWKTAFKDIESGLPWITYSYLKEYIIGYRQFIITAANKPK